MHVAINRLKVPADYAEHLERAFGDSSAMVSVPGFHSFKLLRSVAGGEYLVLTEWESQASFEAWTESESFRRAHTSTTRNSPVTMELSLYEVVTER